MDDLIWVPRSILQELRDLEDLKYIDDLRQQVDTLLVEPEQMPDDNCYYDRTTRLGPTVPPQQLVFVNVVCRQDQLEAIKTFCRQMRETAPDLPEKQGVGSKVPQDTSVSFEGSSRLNMGS